MFDKLPVVARVAELFRNDPLLMAVAVLAFVVFLATVICLAKAREVQR